VLAAALATDAGVRAASWVDLPVARAAAAVRWEPVTDVAVALVGAADVALFPVTAWAVLLVLVATRRHQHLLAALAVLLPAPLLLAEGREVVGRMRPAGVEVLARWDGYAHPSVPVAEAALGLSLATLLLAPPGRWRRRAVGGVAVVLLALVAGRLLTGVDHLSDAVAGLAAGLALPIVIVRAVAPEEAFPVTYHRGVRAHLDVTGDRADAIRRALRAQLGIDATEVSPHALAGSAGSTPLRIRAADGDRFGKLYAAVHLRSDRWYKLARAVRYGRLEDERPFGSVRRLVEYEDHMLRAFRDAGVPVPAPLGIVEITPEREYLLVSEMLTDVHELTEGPVSDAVIDAALDVVRRLWDGGLAHRDVKPSNVLVRGDRVWLVDVAFAELRPSPWRQAVDLANMLLTLSLHAPPAHVYERATRVFSPDEVAEAFAATRSVTVPGQLRALLRARDDDLVATLRALAPPRPPVAIQRWSLRRVALTASLALGAVLAVGLAVENLQLAGLL